MANMNLLQNDTKWKPYSGIQAHHFVEEISTGIPEETGSGWIGTVLLLSTCSHFGPMTCPFKGCPTFCGVAFCTEEVPPPWWDDKRRCWSALNHYFVWSTSNVENQWISMINCHCPLQMQSLYVSLVFLGVIWVSRCKMVGVGASHTRKSHHHVFWDEHLGLKHWFQTCFSLVCTWMAMDSIGWPWIQMHFVRKEGRWTWTNTISKHKKVCVAWQI